VQSVNLDEAEYYGKVSTLPRNREPPGMPLEAAA
jgi:hypothetical protein